MTTPDAARTILTLLAGAILSGSMSDIARAQTPAAAPEVIVVTGRLPGPPLWRVSNGEHDLWIFGMLAPVPEDMVWESARIANIIGKAEVYLPQPRFGIRGGLGMVANPLNWVRGILLAKSITRDPDGRVLQQTLSAEQYQRFSALKTHYFPRDNDFDDMRPYSAVQELSDKVHRKEGLTGPWAMYGQLNKLIKKNRQLETVDTSAIIEWDKGFGELANVVESFRDDLPRDLELACVDHTLTSLETDLVAMKQRANAWAEGDIEALRDIKFKQTAESPCETLQRVGNAAIANGELADLTAQMEAKWFNAADSALANHATSFAVLNINELLKQDGWLAKLRARGYRVLEPDQ